MGGGLIELVAYGAQDIYLTGNPQITFFKVVYRRHTNFSMESIRQDFSGTSDGTMAEIASVDEELLTQDAATSTAIIDDFGQMQMGWCVYDHITNIISPIVTSNFKVIGLYFDI